VQIESRTRGLGLARIIVEIPVAVFEAGYTKEQELEADSEGTRLMVMGGYSPLGSIRMFEAFDRAHREAVARKAASPQEELTNVALQTIEGYFRSHPPSAERANRIRALMDAEHWPAVPEHDLEVGWAFWSARADELLRQHKYPEAQAEAEHVLRVKPGYMKALWIVSQAHLKQGEFAEAAAGLRQMQEQEPHSLNLTYQYAHALAGSPNHASAAREFEEWVNSPQAGEDPLLPIAVAGLKLLAGDERPAQNLVAAARARGWDTEEAARLGYLGWWYYLAGRYDTAAALLEPATNMLPGNFQLQAALGWTNIERAHFGDALRNFKAASGNGPSLAGTDATAYDASTADAGTAVALWLSDQRSEALSQFLRVSEEAAEWRNPRWVRGMYSPNVWRAISQLTAEAERIRKANLRASGHPVPD